MHFMRANEADQMEGKFSHRPKCYAALALLRQLAGVRLRATLFPDVFGLHKMNEEVCLSYDDGQSATSLFGHRRLPPVLLLVLDGPDQKKEALMRSAAITRISTQKLFSRPRRDLRVLERTH